MIRFTGTVFYSLLYLNSRQGFYGLNNMYSVISVIVNSLPGNTKNRESTRSWTERVRVVHPCSAPIILFFLVETLTCKFVDYWEISVLTYSRGSNSLPQTIHKLSLHHLYKSMLRRSIVPLAMLAGLEACSAFAPASFSGLSRASIPHARAMSGLRSGAAPITQTSMASAHDFKLPKVGVCLPSIA